VVRQFLQVITEKGYIPYIIRSDRGKETPLAAEVHFALSRTMNDNPHFKLNDCWFYGTSTANQRVESWWSQLQKSQLYFWRVGVGSHSRDLAKCGVWIFTLEPSTSFFLL
jgi:hypothetical protein